MKKFYFLNTNKTLDPSGFDEQTMLREGIAAAYQKKEDIKKLNEGDVVFLYSNEVGFIACGTVTGKLEKRLYRSRETASQYEAYYKHLVDFIDISDSPISTQDIKTMYGPFNFQRALFQLSNTVGCENIYREFKKRDQLFVRKAA